MKYSDLSIKFDELKASESNLQAEATKWESNYIEVKSNCEVLEKKIEETNNENEFFKSNLINLKKVNFIHT